MSRNVHKIDWLNSIGLDSIAKKISGRQVAKRWQGLCKHSFLVLISFYITGTYTYMLDSSGHHFGYQYVQMYMYM